MSVWGIKVYINVEPVWLTQGKKNTEWEQNPALRHRQCYTQLVERSFVLKKKAKEEAITQNENVQHVLNARDNDKKLGEKENEKEELLRDRDDRQQRELKGEFHSDVPPSCHTTSGFSQTPMGSPHVAAMRRP